MNNIIYIVGLIVIVVAILSYFGLRWPSGRSGPHSRLDFGVAQYPRRTRL